MSAFFRYNNTQPQSAFTLIELSIVLVIIGLLAGGILVGKDLITASSLRAQITQIEKLNQAINTFNVKYGGLPGDLTLANAQQFGFFTPGDCTGQQGGRDGNGLIEGHASPQPLAAQMGENALFWNDLKFARLAEDFFSSTYVSCTATATISSTGISNFLPVAKMGYSNYLHPYSVAGTNWIMMAQVTSFNSGCGCLDAGANIPVSLAYKLDAKLDDGLPTTGTIQAIYINHSQLATINAPNAASDSNTTCYNSTAPAYSVLYNNGQQPNCALSFKFQ